ncbi:MAG: cyclase family protein [Methanothrix sp.]|uniref:cyclase family protein n=1 Tax=Methanothrix TaxID=2222 RepID=UPI0015854A48|nr:MULTISPECIES: cyclase family protein [Methanothrix]MBC7079725.1 cyclase family protein [Methanothrix sp.]NPU87800.1 cyclase family protein [Methanothrix sp.]
MIYDVTHTMSSSLPVYPGDPGFSRDVLKSLDRGDPYTLSALHLSAHAGTHIDAPSHFISSGRSVHEIPIERLIMMVALIDSGMVVSPENLSGLNPPAEGVMFRTGSLMGEISESAARACVDLKLKLVGTDALSVDSLEGDVVHRILLSNDILILEGLCLDGVPAGIYTLICMPLKIEGAEASPVRAILAPAEWRLTTETPS